VIDSTGNGSSNDDVCVTEYRNAVDVFVDAKKSDTPIHPRPDNIPRIWPFPPRGKRPEEPGDPKQ